MAFEAGRQEIIERLVHYIAQKAPPQHAMLLKSFVRQYYLSVSPEDLSSRTLSDLFQAASSHWGFIACRQKGQDKIRLFNPTIEQEGWHSPHTLIEIVCDDRPFLVDSLLIALQRQDLKLHLMIHMGDMKVSRDEAGEVVQFHETETLGLSREAALYLEIDRIADQERLKEMESLIHQTLKEVHTVVEDWPLMQQEGERLLESLAHIPKNELTEASSDFLKWLFDHFTFLGYSAFKIEEKNNEKTFEPIKGSGLGLFRYSVVPAAYFSKKTPLLEAFLDSSEWLLLGKTPERSTVHRGTFLDFISIKVKDEAGNLIGEKRLIGLYSEIAYNSRPQNIPLIKTKISQTLKRAGFVPQSHDSRALLNILETLPREDLFQASEKELLELSAGILHLQERQRIRLFMRKDLLQNFISCLIFIPKEKFTSTLANKFKSCLKEALNGLEVEFSTRFSDSTLARLHYWVRLDAQNPVHYDIKELEKKLMSLAESWEDKLKLRLLEAVGATETERLFLKYGYSFPVAYQEDFSVEEALNDILHFEAVPDAPRISLHLYETSEALKEGIRLKLYKRGETIPLSDVVPILENMDLRIISERPYAIFEGTQKASLWINEYKMIPAKGGTFELPVVQEIFQEAFEKIWEGVLENDVLNRLIVISKLTWREILVLQAYNQYLWQIGFGFSQLQVKEVLVEHFMFSSEILALFNIRFNPHQPYSTLAESGQVEKMEKYLEGVSSLNDDRILRRFMQLILATVRTNYYQKGKSQKPKSYLSFKIQSEKVPELPLPIPLYEIFVYSSKIEGIHLRASKVARGGIRWSDRKEDYRTEVLGLMKTQQVKNAVIVPMGAKGGFVLKTTSVESAVDKNKEGLFAYEIFIRGLLDLTDNNQKQTCVPPSEVRCHDALDPYLVVAADKGTAHFSDAANAISKEYGFWLGDAFASGGSAGFDHKKMGITARGAFESVKAHFREERDIPQKNYTVVGIGDMGGDVFGNGLLLSPHFKLIAAFNHIHIFLDPNPDPARSFLERQRLFKLGASWTAYDQTVLSSGGGFYSRTAKWIELSPEIQHALQFPEAKATPEALIRAILTAPVDLLWNGGIGTYVKAQSESHASVNDKTNDALRVNGKELRCRVVAEGGNLGFTQLGRVEYARAGGRLNTDAIDNSGGVHCSDYEVNLKILLDRAVQENRLSLEGRNTLLLEAQDEVASLILKNNRLQTEAISRAQYQAADSLEMHAALIEDMERTGKINRALEGLPSPLEMSERKRQGIGLTRPELAVLMAYSKMILKKAFLQSNLPEDPAYQYALEAYFPKPFQRRFKADMHQHPLKREIISTELSNTLIHEMGITFVSRLQDETAREPADIVRAYTVVKHVFKIEALKEALLSLGYPEQHQKLQEISRLLRRGTRWVIKNQIPLFSDQKSIQRTSALLEILLLQSSPESSTASSSTFDRYIAALDILAIAHGTEIKLDKVSEIYGSVGALLKLDAFKELIKKQPVTNRWEALARAHFGDDLDRLQRNLTRYILQDKNLDGTLSYTLGVWSENNTAILKRWEYLINELQSASEPNFIMFAVILRELLEMVDLKLKAVA